MEIIKSKSNSTIKSAVQLKQKKYREESGCCLIEGIKILTEAIKNNIEIQKVFVSQHFKEEIDVKADIIIVSDEIISYLSSVPSPQGVVAVIKTKKYVFEAPKRNFLLLDNIQDPSNLGAIIRTAVATNFLDIYMINCCEEYNEKVIRSSMGNLFKCRFFDIDYEMVDSLKNYLFFADMNGKNIFGYEKFDSIVGFCIGNEGHGVSKEIREKITNCFSIPMENNVESLNASVSASIIMYHIRLNQKEN